jgi:Transglutaminase-like enzymes, putative cysteine proteases
LPTVVFGAEISVGSEWQFSNYDEFKLSLDGKQLKLSNIPGESVLICVVNSAGVTTIEREITKSMPYTNLALSDGEYFLELYVSVGSGNYESYVFGRDLRIRVTNSGIRFMIPDALDDNTRIYNLSRNDLEAQKFYTKPSFDVQSDDPVIIAKAAEIVGDKTGMDEIKALYDHVTSGYYDFDALKNGVAGETDAISTMKTMVGVCDNFSNYFAALARSRGWPVKVISGKSDRGMSHSWNEVFIDGVWVMFDPTFGLIGAYENGRKTSNAGVHRYRYFAATMEGFSIDHEYIERSETGIKAISTDSFEAVAFSGELRVLGKTILEQPAVKNIGGNNCVGLRDFADMLNGTSKQFSVDWNGAVVIETNAPYMPNGNEYRLSMPGSDPARIVAYDVYIDGIRTYVLAYNIGGHTFVQIRSICKALDIGVSYDGRNVIVDTSIEYSE